MVNISHYGGVWWTYKVDAKQSRNVHPLRNSGNSRCSCVIEPVNRNTEQDPLVLKTKKGEKFSPQQFTHKNPSED